MYSGKLGVGIICFDRPQYLKQLLASLEENTELENTDFHFFQDGAINKFSGHRAGCMSRISQSIELAMQARLPNTHFHIREENVGIGINQFEAYEVMTKLYDVVLMLEDDIVVSPYYLRVMRVLFDSIATMENVFSASAGFLRLCSPDQVNDCLDKMSLQKWHWCAEMFASAKWPKLRTPFLEYYELIKNIDYRDRSSTIIHDLFARHHFSCIQTSQDAGKNMAIAITGMDRICLMVNRAMYIGKQGQHGRPEHYQKMGWAHQTPYIFPEDESIQRFELI